MRIKNFLIFILIFLLAGCGGGGGSSSGGASTGTVSVIINDDLSTDYTKAWVTILAVTAVSTGGHEHELYNDPTGRVYNLLELSDVGSLLTTTELPSGDYDTIRITLNNQIVLVDDDGVSIEAKFSDSGTEFVIDVSGTLTVIQGQNISFGLDFDVEQFTYNPSTNLVSAVIIFESEDDLDFLSEIYAEIEGDVTEIVDTSTFRMRLEDSGIILTVILDPSAIVFDEDTETITSDTSLLQPLQEVEVYGTYDSASLTVTAFAVETESDDDDQEEYEAEGYVVTFDDGTSIITLDVIEAENFIPNTSIITVDISGAVFSEGDISMIVTGQSIEVEGIWDGSTFTADTIEVEVDDE